MFCLDVIDQKVNLITKYREEYHYARSLRKLLPLVKVRVYLIEVGNIHSELLLHSQNFNTAILRNKSNPPFCGAISLLNVPGKVLALTFLEQLKPSLNHSWWRPSVVLGRVAAWSNKYR